MAKAMEEEDKEVVEDHTREAEAEVEERKKLGIQSAKK